MASSRGWVLVAEVYEAWIHLSVEWSATRPDGGLRDQAQGARRAVGQPVAAGREDRWVVS